MILKKYFNNSYCFKMFISKIKKNLLSRFEARLARANHVPRDLQEPITYHEKFLRKSKNKRRPSSRYLIPKTSIKKNWEVKQVKET